MAHGDEKLREALQALIAERLGSSPEVRAFIAELARWTLAEIDRIESPPEPAASPARAAPPGPDARQPDDSEAPSAEPAVTIPLKIGDALAGVTVSGSRQEVQDAKAALVAREEAQRYNGKPEPPPDLGLIAVRSRLKAESCRHLIVRRSVQGDPERERPAVDRINEMIGRARELDKCFLWAFWPHAEQPDDESLRRIATCYDALAEGAELCREMTEPGAEAPMAELKRAFQLFAEMSSALRVALEDTWLTSPDRDQDDAHIWLRRATFDLAVYVPRYMALDDPADPHRASDTLAEIRGLAGLVSDRKRSRKRIDELFARIRYHLRQFPESGHADTHDCRRVNESLDELLELGLRPSDARFDELRSEVNLAAFPEDRPAHPVLQRTDALEPRFDPPDAREKWSERVLEARELLRGGTIVVVGGEPRLDAIERMVDAFELKDVDWIPLTEHGTGAPMRAPIARPETLLVLVIIKLCGHLHSDEARGYAREAGKPFVMLPAGYNPEQIAEQVLQQASVLLAG